MALVLQMLQLLQPSMSLAVSMKTKHKAAQASLSGLIIIGFVFCACLPLIKVVLVLPHGLILMLGLFVLTSICWSVGGHCQGWSYCCLSITSVTWFVQTFSAATAPGLQCVLSLTQSTFLLYKCCWPSIRWSWSSTLHCSAQISSCRCGRNSQVCRSIGCLFTSACCIPVVSFNLLLPTVLQYIAELQRCCSSSIYCSISGRYQRLLQYLL